jgi:hypothetical protein
MNGTISPGRIAGRSLVALSPSRHGYRLNRKEQNMNSQMSGAADGNRGGRRAGLWRAGVLAAAVAAMTLPAAACSGGGSAAGPGTHLTAYQRELAYAVCMRGHGDPGFPDPQSNGLFAATKANRGALAGPRFASANRACAHLEGPGLTPAQQERQTAELLRLAACMRAHGITNFQYSPPRNGGQGGLGAQGVNPNSPQFQAAQQACRKLQPRLGGG